MVVVVAVAMAMAAVWGVEALVVVVVALAMKDICGTTLAWRQTHAKTPMRACRGRRATVVWVEDSMVVMTAVLELVVAVA